MTICVSLKGSCILSEKIIQFYAAITVTVLLSTVR